MESFKNNAFPYQFTNFSTKPRVKRTVPTTWIPSALAFFGGMTGILIVLFCR